MFSDPRVLTLLPPGCASEHLKRFCAVQNPNAPASFPPFSLYHRDMHQYQIPSTCKSRLSPRFVSTCSPHRRASNFSPQSADFASISHVVHVVTPQINLGSWQLLNQHTRQLCTPTSWVDVVSSKMYLQNQPCVSRGISPQLAKFGWLTHSSPSNQLSRIRPRLRHQGQTTRYISPRYAQFRAKIVMKYYICVCKGIYHSKFASGWKASPSQSVYKASMR